ncbi:MAG: CinA family protein, partial [Helicobacteraceae bacterium]|nr:CinA family protein [Helicobacteraceae bacterium]
MLEQNRLVCVNLLGFDPASAVILTKPCADRLGLRVEAREHIGGWSVLECRESNEALAFAKEICVLFAPKAFAGDPFAFALEALKRRKEMISFAESCTGGLLAAYFTAHAGASEVFGGSLVTYSNRLKTDWLGVDRETLRDFGAVSAECVAQMALGALRKSGANHALSISGVAGPGGGDAKKPVGTTFIGYASSDGETFAEELHLKGSRS